MVGQGIYSVNRQDIILMCLGVFIPPVPVIMRKGFWSRDTLLSFLLTIIFYFPAIVHSAYVIYETSTQRPNSNSGASGSRLGSRNTDDESRTPLNNGSLDVDLEASPAEEALPAEPSHTKDAQLPSYEEVPASSAVFGDNKVQH
ncbi:Sna3p KNAG_0C02530 [Huiozyma naganishii CBS 8797]|uniref:Uncharacterized protein n=1 Tax=Huiozyma naganishii (strain ATCC MYA-139 / BCRC 22969 / CBS 8797 / KCTC 17520 / NBRC 10181 / NCYC 3082 / Yp74L-3) TaxID=1071383 RepID=J7S4M0_HUIN7|nr:hypothetical protein KNAG_0C02530 [Kazachstania naganishii CBS 8797]CCK69364.1 hypothetical protein KNAG_0C02530 [Kazachstania naganishii CBS 8797]